MDPLSYGNQTSFLASEAVSFPHHFLGSTARPLSGHPDILECNLEDLKHVCWEEWVKVEDWPGGWDQNRRLARRIVNTLK